MQSELQEKINLLIEMAGSQTSYDALSEELEDLERDISAKKNEVKGLKKSIKDEKYVKDNERIIDENIKVGLENKKQQFLMELEEAQEKLEKTSREEEDVHQSLVRATNRLTELNSLLETLRLKLRVVHQNESLNNFYETMIETITNEITETEKKKEILSGNYRQIQERLESFGNQVASLEQKLDSISSKLEDTLQALANPNSYVDTYMKKQDLKKVDVLNQELEELEQQKVVLLSDPVYVGHEACLLLEEDDKTGALSYLKELVKIIEAKPYMTADVENLQELLEQATNTRDEFVNVIENRAYIGEDFEVIDTRIQHLESQIASLRTDETYWKKKMQSIDEERVVQLLTLLDEVKTLYDRSKEEYDTYQQVIFDDDDTKSPRKKAGLQSAYKRKKEELDAIGMIVEAYQVELEGVIAESRTIESTILADLKAKMQQLEEEIQALKKKKKEYTHAKDILAVERDRKTLKKLSDDVDAIKHRLEYTKSATQLYDEIEISLCSFEEKETPSVSMDEELTRQVSDYIDLSDFRIQDSSLSEDNHDVMNLFQEVKEDLEEPVQKEDKPVISKELEEENNVVFPPRKTVLPDEKRFKVLKVEPLELNESKESMNNEEEPLVESLDEEEFPIFSQPLVNEESLQESENPLGDEYISFNELLNGGNADEN